MPALMTRVQGFPQIVLNPSSARRVRVQQTTIPWLTHVVGLTVVDGAVHPITSPFKVKLSDGAEVQVIEIHREHQREFVLCDAVEGNLECAPPPEIGCVDGFCHHEGVWYRV